jgi:hypothetical protein
MSIKRDKRKKAYEKLKNMKNNNIKKVFRNYRITMKMADKYIK